MGSDIFAVDRINLKIREGEVFGLLGPNGAGKTTLIRMLATLLLPTSGKAAIFGYDVVQKDYEVKKLIGVVSSDERSFYWRLTGRENIHFFSALYNLSKKETAKQCDDLFELFGLTEVADFRFNEYSTGMKQRLAIIRGLLNRPRILLMDEPTRGIDPVAAETIHTLIKKEIRNLFGCTIIITTNILSEAEELCNSIGIIDHGKLLTAGDIKGLKEMLHSNLRYNLSVTDLSERHFGMIGEIKGVISLSRNGNHGSVSDIRITMDNQEEILTEVFRFILQNNGSILSCNREDTSLEDIFHFFTGRAETGKSIQVRGS